MPVQPIGSDSAAVSAVYSLEPAKPAASANNGASSLTKAISIAGDSAVAPFGNIAPADLERLVSMLQQPVAAETTARVGQLQQRGAAALSQNNAAAAIEILNKIGSLDPMGLEVLRVDPVWRPVRVEIDHLLDRFTAAARLDAEDSLSRAGRVLESFGDKLLPGWQTRPGALLASAQRMFDAGGYANYVTSAYLAEMLSGYSLSTSTLKLKPPNSVVERGMLQKNIDRSWALIRNRVQFRLKRLWVRAPLLVLLLAWIAIGLAAGSTSVLFREFSHASGPELLFGRFYDVWGIGFLALIGFGFWARVTNPRE